MGDLQQEQRYMCKICGKCCVSGKSLGGHMRVHLALLSAYKKAEAAEVKDQELKESSKNQSNGTTAFSVLESSKNVADFEDGDQNINYELRENPKKSWRISDSKHGLNKKGTCCKECGKEFATFRALSGHMRCHSLKNQKAMYNCEKCGKGFDSVRAMYGHMKSHSKKSRVRDESAETVSDLETLCLVRRKRSRIRYKVNPNPSFSSLSASVVSVVGEEEEAANCLMMLSRGVRDCVGFSSVKESSDDDDDGSSYFGSKSSLGSKKVCGNGGDLVCDGDETKKLSLSPGNLDYCVSGAANASSVKNVSEVDVLDLGFTEDDDGKKADDEHKFGKHVKIVEYSAVKQEYSDDSKSFISAMFKRLDKDPLVATGMDGASSEFLKLNSCNKTSVSVHFSVSEKKFCENYGDDDAILKDTESYKGKTKGSTSQLSVTEPDSQLEQELGDVGFVSLDLSKSKERKCPICFKVFSSGQALGGHKRAHLTGFTAESKSGGSTTVKQEVNNVRDFLDLNFPVTQAEGTKDSFWWRESGNEHETLVLTS